MDDADLEEVAIKSSTKWPIKLTRANSSEKPDLHS
jgi:hypothetical protein